eukprot:CAMPEP_0183508722 /NCGR_PEP_ID=MMETSP0371-20130417/9070_1 /TAXON_ID=268820 /ORGANISM="Peridinium aciculiferum, Strain PAER-2" /LENGTH=103 /DNA_ID=CAMNT_0025705163 /DNA_START=54 /DNA_END=365 /DNA_ORIENTATION=-
MSGGGELGAALRAAAASGELRALRALLAEDAKTEAGALNSADEAGCTALIYAASTGNAELLSALMAAKADVEATTKKGKSALSVAEQCGHTVAARVLKGESAV